MSNRSSLYGYFRWGLTISLLLMAVWYFSYTIYAGWQTGAPGANAQTDVWSYESYNALGRTIALITCAVIAFVNIRPGWPYLKSKRNLLLTGVVLAAFFIPPATRYFQIDGCLDAGGTWDYDHGVCVSAV